jgi:hypothetical protein
VSHPLENIIFIAVISLSFSNVPIKLAFDEIEGFSQMLENYDAVEIKFQVISIFYALQLSVRDTRAYFIVISSQHKSSSPTLIETHFFLCFFAMRAIK